MDETATRTASARQAILEAAVELIRQRGVAGTSISDVVARSGTSAGAIYHHFGSKERLVLQVARISMAIPLGMIMRTLPGLSPAELFNAALSQVTRNDETAQVLLQIWAGAQGDPALAQLLGEEATAMREGVVAFVGGWCAEHSPQIDPEAAVSMLMSLVTGYAVQRGLGMNVDLDSYRALGTTAIAAATAPTSLAAAGR